VYPNGSWYSQNELACIQPAVPPIPPIPAGPGKPVAQYNVSGLSVSRALRTLQYHMSFKRLQFGIRPGSRTIQSLSIINDTRWYSNFSFVPPLWSWAYPQKDNRSHAGANAIGDITLRVQPVGMPFRLVTVYCDPLCTIGVDNASDWAFYSSSRGSGVVDLRPIPNSDPNVLEEVDMTPALVAPGQVLTVSSPRLSLSQ
jgi:hypothetical protein